MKVTTVALLMVLILVFGGAFAFANAPDPDPQPADERAAVRRGEFGEAPMLAALVDAGELDPVELRIPKNPKVVETIESIGRYGGDLKVFAITPSIFNNDMQGMKGTSLLRIPRNGLGVEPDVCEGYELSEDGLTVTWHLREGMRWSDGAPFTSEDMRFANEDCTNDPDVRSWTTNGYTSCKVIDDYTIEMFRPTGHSGAAMFANADWFGGYAVMYQPAHYLKQFHGKYNENADARAKEEGYDTWQEAFGEGGLYWWAPLRNPDKPQIEPWDLVDWSDTLQVKERNPYFFRVDAEGNQLPYIDRWISQVVDLEVYGLKVTGGEADIAYNQTRLEDMAIYQQGAQAGDYTITLYPGVAIAEMKMRFQSWHANEMKREILNDVRFRQALSVAINRAEIQEVIYQGQGRAGAIAPLESCSFYVEGWRDYYAQYDPELANRLLDEVGLDKRDADGFRMWQNGQTLSEAILYAQPKFNAELELIAEYFADVGLKIVPNLQDVAIITELTEQTRESFLNVHANANIPPGNERATYGNVWQWPHDFNVDAWEDTLYFSLQSTLGQDWIRPDDWWFMDFPDGTGPGDWDQLPGVSRDYGWVVRPDDDILNNCMLEDMWGNTEMGTPEYVELAQEYFDWQVKHIPFVGTVGEMPTVYITKNDLGNTIPIGWVAGMPLRDDVTQTWADQLYWK